MEDVAVYLVENQDTKDVATLHKMVQEALQYAAAMGIKMKIDWASEELDNK
jgi:hypothetical protein